MDQALLIAIMVFMMTMLAMVGVFSIVRSKHIAKEWGDRIKGKSRSTATTEADKGLAYFSGIFLKLLEKLGQANKPTNQAETSQIRKRLVTAGFRGPRATVIFLGSKIFFGVLLGTLFFLFGADLTKGMSPNTYTMLMVGSGLAGFYAPQVFLGFAVSRRQEKLVNGFPDALDLMVVCVEAGLGLDQAIARVGEEIKMGHVELGDEFELVSLELRAGFSREQGLAKFK